MPSVRRHGRIKRRRTKSGTIRKDSPSSQQLAPGKLEDDQPESADLGGSCVYVFLIVPLLTRRRGETRMVKPSRIVSHGKSVVVPPGPGSSVSEGDGAGAADLLTQQRVIIRLPPIPSTVRSTCRAYVSMHMQTCPYVPWLEEKR